MRVFFLVHLLSEGVSLHDAIIGAISGLPASWRPEIPAPVLVLLVSQVLLLLHPRHDQSWIPHLIW